MKSWYKSKTVWFAILQIIFGACLIVADQSTSEHIAGYAGMAAGFIQVILRWRTDAPVSSPVKALDSMRGRISRNEKARLYRAQ
jgi:hypothetical protein